MPWSNSVTTGQRWRTCMATRAGGSACSELSQWRWIGVSKAIELAKQLITQRIDTVSALTDVRSEDLNQKNQDGRTMRSVVRVMHDHEMSHLVHVQKTRQALGALPTEAQMILAQALQARAALAAALVGLSDDDLERQPEDGQWSIREIVEHMIRYDPVLVERVTTQFGVPNS